MHADCSREPPHSKFLHTEFDNSIIGAHAKFPASKNPFHKKELSIETQTL